MGFMDDLNDMFNKSAAAAGDMLNKGASAAGRMADSANLRFKQGEIDRRWKDACAALGESVIEAVKADPALLSGREQMMADLDAIAKERADVADELQRIAAEAEAARRAGRVKTCPECGAKLASMRSSACIAVIRCLSTSSPSLLRPYRLKQKATMRQLPKRQLKVRSR